MGRYLQTSEASYILCKHHHLRNSLRIMKMFCTKTSSRFIVFACRWTWDPCLRYVNFVFCCACVDWWWYEALACCCVLASLVLMAFEDVLFSVFLHGCVLQGSNHIVTVVYSHLWISGSTHISTPSPHLVFSRLVMSFRSREVKILMGPTPIFGFDAITCFKSRSSALLFHHV